jgi:thymidylate synthase (FAD)
MAVSLISYTKSCIHESNDIQEFIAYCARVSNPTNQLNTETSERLIKYLIRHKHWSPFEMASICLEITTTRDIARQLLRHRSFSFQEFSQRYADPTQSLGIVIREARLQDRKNRQNSIDIFDEKLQAEWAQKQKDVWKVCEGAYKWAQENGLAKEVSRSVLPEGLMESRLYMHGTIRSWIHYIETRTDPTTQKEHREIAQKCANEVSKCFPHIFIRTSA